MCVTGRHVYFIADLGIVGLLAWSFEIIVRIIGGMRQLQISALCDDSLLSAAPSFICAGVHDKLTL